MKNKVEIDGKWYELVPLEEETDDTIKSVTFYYACDSDCGKFKFSVLLDKNGNVWEDTQSVSYYPNGRKEESEYWDNPKFLISLLDPFTENTHVMDLKRGLASDELNTLLNLLRQVREKDWI